MAGQSKLAVPGTYDRAVSIMKVARFFSGLPDFRNQTPTMPNLPVARAADPDGDQQKQHQVTEQKFSLLISGQRDHDLRLRTSSRNIHGKAQG